MSGFLDLYEPLDIIGNGSFGIIRKVRRKSDGLIFARKELNFDRMNERDRKQIVAEVNILKELHHDHIVRYHDRYVDRDAGILYILMEYCGGGDLSSVIKQAQKSNRLIPEDTIWNYFFQILLALSRCHHPNGHGRSGSASSVDCVESGKDRRVQILHRDLKPDNVFLDETNRVKLGDFGLSKALPQASFANTYVGAPYYMSPELMQEKAYDSKSDIWSLGCLIYELCALKPPFHEAKTHNELSIFIRNGRIPPLPRGYSQSLSAVIKAMLNLNPAMRPSAAQLLQHERLELVMKVSETEKMLNTVKTHRATVSAKERELLAREQELLTKESTIVATIAEKDAEIAHLRQLVSQQDQRIHEAVSRREEELRVLVMAREAEVSAAITKREEEIMSAVREREEMLCEALRKGEIEIKEREEWTVKRCEELKEEEDRLHKVKLEVEDKVRAWEMKEKEGVTTKGRKDKNPLEEVKNLLARVNTDDSPPAPIPTPRIRTTNRHLQTPLPRNNGNSNFVLGSAMRGVVFTTTGQALATPAPNDILATPSPAELANLFVKSPQVGLDFSAIFNKPLDLDKECESADESDHSPPPSPSKKERSRPASAAGSSESSSSSSSSATTTAAARPSEDTTPTARPTRLRRPSMVRAATTKAIKYGPKDAPSQPEPSSSNPQPRSSGPTRSVSTTSLPPAPTYDMNDEENLPSPFIKRTASVDLGMKKGSNGKTVTRRTSNAHLLRAVAVHNAAKAATGSSSGTPTESTRPALAVARKASEEARKALSKS